MPSTTSSRQSLLSLVLSPSPVLSSSLSSPTQSSSTFASSASYFRSSYLFCSSPSLLSTIATTSYYSITSSASFWWQVYWLPTLLFQTHVEGEYADDGDKEEDEQDEISKKQLKTSKESADSFIISIILLLLTNYFKPKLRQTFTAVRENKLPSHAFNASEFKNKLNHHHHRSSSRLLSTVVTLLLLLVSVFTECHGSEKVTQPGDILLGGIFPIHQKGKGRNTRPCLSNRTAIVLLYI